VYEDPGVIANIKVSWLDPSKVRRMTFVGSRKMMVYDDMASEDRIRIHDKGVLRPEGDANDAGIPMSYRYGDVVSPYFEMNEPLQVEDEHFLDCILTGMIPVSNGENGLAVVRALEAAQRSLDLGRAVALDELDPVPDPGSALIPAQRSATKTEKSVL
jgi:predicted dehydrogenase